MKDSKSVLDMKNSAIGRPASTTSNAVVKDDSFKLYHLLICAILGVVVGAYAQL